MPELRVAIEEDMAGIRALLDDTGLPTSDFVSSRPEFVVIRQDDRILAAGGLERFGSVALLRSVVVAKDRRGEGWERRIVQELERIARESHLEGLVLLTQTARDYFSQQGYSVVARSSVPQELQQSEEFRSLCPASAVCMVKSMLESA